MGPVKPCAASSTAVTPVAVAQAMPFLHVVAHQPGIAGGGLAGRRRAGNRDRIGDRFGREPAQPSDRRRHALPAPQPAVERVQRSEVAGGGNSYADLVAERDGRQHALGTRRRWLRRWRSPPGSRRRPDDRTRPDARHRDPAWRRSPNWRRRRRAPSDARRRTSRRAGPLPQAWMAALRPAMPPTVPCPATAAPIRSKTARIAAARTDFGVVCELQAKVASASATVMEPLRERNVAWAHVKGQ